MGRFIGNFFVCRSFILEKNFLVLIGFIYKLKTNSEIKSAFILYFPFNVHLFDERKYDFRLKAAWYEFIDYDRVKKEQEECIRIWRISNFRESSNVNKPLLDPEGSERGKDPVRRILKRIESYQVPKPPPAIELGKPVVPAVDVGSLENMHASLENHFRVLKKYSE